MKVFAKFVGHDDDLVYGQTYLIHVYSRSENLNRLNVKIADFWWNPYKDYEEFAENWEIR